MIIYSLFVFLFLSLNLIFVYERVKNDKWYKYLLILPLIVLTLLLSFNIFNVNIHIKEFSWNISMLLSSIIINVVLVVYFILNRKQIRYKRFLLVPVIIIIDLLLKIFFSLITSHDFNYYNDLYTHTLDKVLFMITYLIVTFSTTYIFINTKNNRYDLVSKIVLISFGFFVSLILAIGESIIDIVGVIGGDSSIRLLLIILFFLLATIVVAFVLYEGNKYNEREKIKAAQVYNQVSDHYSKQMLLNQEELIKIKHDINNYLEVIKLKDDESFKAIQQKINKYGSIYFCKDDILNKILVLKASEAKKYSIEFNVKTNLDDSIKLESIDKISLFTNLLDNAIEASKNSVQKIINLEVVLENNSLRISIVNSCDELKQKRDRTYHGKGKEIIKDLIIKNSGTIKSYYSNKLYSVNIELLIK